MIRKSDAIRVVELVRFIDKHDPDESGKRFSVPRDKASQCAANILEATGIYVVNRDFESWTIRLKGNKEND